LIKIINLAKRGGDGGENMVMRYKLAVYTLILDLFQIINRLSEMVTFFVNLTTLLFNFSTTCPRKIALFVRRHELITKHQFIAKTRIALRIYSRRCEEIMYIQKEKIESNILEIINT